MYKIILIGHDQLQINKLKQITKDLLKKEDCEVPKFIDYHDLIVPGKKSNRKEEIWKRLLKESQKHNIKIKTAKSLIQK